MPLSRPRFLSSRTTIVSFAAALLAGSSLLSPLQAAPSDADFLQAREYFRVGDGAKLERLAPRLGGHPLETYVRYWQIRLRLDVAEPDLVRAYLVRYKDTRTGDAFSTQVPNAEALEAFRHPNAYRDEAVAA